MQPANSRAQRQQHERLQISGTFKGVQVPLGNLNRDDEIWPYLALQTELFDDEHTWGLAAIGMARIALLRTSLGATKRGCCRGLLVL